jgi:hypothetical protein
MTGIDISEIDSSLSVYGGNCLGFIRDFARQKKPSAAIFIRGIAMPSVGNFPWLSPRMARQYHGCSEPTNIDNSLFVLAS